MTRIVVLLLLTLLALGSCAAGPARPGSPDAAPQEGSVLPAPAQLAQTAGPRKLTAYVPGALMKEGEAFNYSLPHQRVHASGTATIFTPAWDGDQNAGFGALSFAIFDFSIAGYNGAPELHYHWNVAPAMPESVFFGLANWQADRWDWFAGNAVGSLPFGATAPYINGNGRLLLCVMQYLPDTNKIDWVRIGAP